jgi:mono/diheme cytochrome c family protein
VKKTNQKALKTFRAFTIGFSVSLLALACGSDDGGNDGAGNDEGEVVDAPVDVARPSQEELCQMNPLLAGCDADTGEVAQPPPDTGDTGDVDTGDVDTPPPASSEYDLQKAAAENILRANCGQCHGTVLDEEDALAGMNYIDDLERLIEEGKVIGGNSAESPVITRMRNGSMPPASSNGPRPSDQDIDTVAAFIDNPTFFPDARVEDCSGQLKSFDEIFAQIQTDILSEDADDREFLRYLLLTNRYNAGVCEQDLDTDRFGMSKMLNMLSINSRVEEPLAIDSEETIYRIDIRDYGWDRDVEVDGVNFVDGWEAIVANNQYAVEFEGDEAEQVILQANTNIPTLYADALIDQASIGNLYYALVDVDVDQTLDDFIINELGIDIDDNIDQRDVIRAGTTQSVISRQDRVVERHEIEVRAGAFWQSFDFDADEANESIFDDPFGFAEGGSEAIFTLPNGFLAYIIADENRNIVEESDILFDTLQNDFVARTSVSCSGCHAQGMLPVQDEVRSVVELNRFNFNADDFEAVQEIYPTVEEFAREVEIDSDNFKAALGRAGVPENVADPMSGVFLRFDRDLGLRDIAGDLGVSETLLANNIARLDPQLQIVGANATIDRDDFTDLFLASLCVMQSFSQNQPNLADCDDAIAALDD